MMLQHQPWIKAEQLEGDYLRSSLWEPQIRGSALAYSCDCWLQMFLVVLVTLLKMLRGGEWIA